MFYIFLMGRPGCGKSEIYRRVAEELKNRKLASDFMRVDDFPKLWAKFTGDDAAEKAGKPRKYSRATADGGYLVTNDGVWDEILKEVDADLKNLSRPGRAIFIEFSRPNYVHSILNNFSKNVLDAGVVVYIDCSFETCWQRNVRRHEAAVAAGGDDHLVSREEMEKTYLHDDRDALVKNGKISVVVVDNEKDGTEHLAGATASVLAEMEKIVKTRKIGI
ncbi:MAG: hypothetical protein QME32_08470 [Endomicrobiia bacterium]|nr:hypothetical protein [Endomicrobiia bacterium]